MSRGSRTIVTRLIPIALALLWGLNWPAVRLCLNEIPPFGLRMIGLTLGAAILFALAKFTGRSLAVRPDQRLRLITSGILNIAIFNVTTVFAQLNTLRATGITPAIAPMAASPTTQAAAVDMLFKERAYWLFLTGHRLGDMRRLIRQYGRTAATVFPIGPMRYRPGNTYGNDVNLVIPFIERNNPKFAGCLDRNP
jgi:hypothetical protein